MLVLWLPVILASTALVVNLGNLLLHRARLQSGTDLAALAAVQSVDWEALVEGEVRLLEDIADAKAREYTALNLEALGDIEADAIDVWVINAAPDAPASHPITGTALEHPTVVLRVEAPGPTPLLLGSFGEIVLVAEADASIRPRDCAARGVHGERMWARGRSFPAFREKYQRAPVPPIAGSVRITNG